MRRRNNQRALSTVVAGAFFVVLAVLSLAMLSWQINLFDQEFSQARLKLQQTLDRFEEDAEITVLTVNSTTNKISATIVNHGTHILQIVAVWITEYPNSPTPSWHRRFALNQRINSGRTVANIGQELSQTFTSTYTYVAKFVTAPGNILVGVYSPIDQLTRTGVSTTGYLFFTFRQDTFMMTNASQPSPVPAWSISPGTQKIVWWIKVSNHGLHDVILYKYTALTLMQIKKADSVTQTRFYIVKNTTTNWQDAQAYVDLSQVIPANPDDPNTGGPEEWVKFSADQVDPNQEHLTQNWNAITRSEYMIFMIFYYKYGTEDLTQLIPFVGVHVL